jgi:DNA-binding response OmpR family regulator
MNDQILLVDDDPATIQVLAQILSSVGKLRFAVTGEDALRLARASAPDLILLGSGSCPGLRARHRRRRSHHAGTRDRASFAERRAAPLEGRL